VSIVAAATNEPISETLAKHDARAYDAGPIDSAAGDGGFVETCASSLQPTYPSITYSHCTANVVDATFSTKHLGPPAA
jgi:hypothetical protein